MVETVIDTDDTKAKKAAMVNLSNDSSPDATSHHITHFSDWRKLKVAVACFLKLRDSSRHESQEVICSKKSKKASFVAGNLLLAELAIIKSCE